jgi:hypothetical protein
MSAEPEYANHRSTAGTRLSVVTGENEAQPRVIHIQDAAQVYEITGVRVDHVSTEVPQKPQWLEISLYRCHDGTGRYVLHFVGRSVLYHTSGSQCNTGVPTAVSDRIFPRDAEPCRRCKPVRITQLNQDELSDTVFELEMDRHKVETADGRPQIQELPASRGESGRDVPQPTENQLWDASAERVLQLLHDSWQQRPSSTATLSAPAQRLVDIAATHDPHIARAVRRIVKL